MPSAFKKKTKMQTLFSDADHDTEAVENLKYLKMPHLLFKCNFTITQPQGGEDKKQVNE